MKKIISFILAFTMIFYCTSCGTATLDSSSEQVGFIDDTSALRAELENAKSTIYDKNSEIEALKQQLEKKENTINQLNSDISELTQFKNTYEGAIETYTNLMDIGGSYWQRTQNLPEYKEGSLTLEPREGCVLGEDSGYRFDFERKYRLSYYGITNLPLEMALKIVRGYTENDIYTKEIVPLSTRPSYYVYHLDLWDMYKGEPLMHYFSWFIEAYRVSRDEMEQVVEILSDPEHMVYESKKIGDATYVGVKDVDFTHEYYELPNVDILYTFDANIINEYYRYA